MFLICFNIKLPKIFKLAKIYFLSLENFKVFLLFIKIWYMKTIRMKVKRIKHNKQQLT